MRAKSPTHSYFLEPISYFISETFFGDYATGWRENSSKITLQSRLNLSLTKKNLISSDHTKKFSYLKKGQVPKSLCAFSKLKKVQGAKRFT